MKIIFKNCFQYTRIGLLIVCLALAMNGLHAQTLVGTRSIPSTQFPSIKVAVDSLNLQGVGPGGITFNVLAGHAETLLAPLVVNVTGTAANPIVFQKSGVGANPLITSFTGVQLASSATTIDVMWSFVGSDFVTINGIDLQEDALNTTPTTQMEVGFGFYKSSASDGTNNNTVQNCTITLNRNNITASSTGPRANASGSVGIEVVNALPSALGTALTVTAVSGASSNNKFYGNTIQNVNFGIFLSGFAAASPYTLADLNNDIGGTSALTGNNIINFGGGLTPVSACGAIFINNQWSFNISYNTVNNNTGTGINHAGGNRGIWLFNSSAGASCNINFNKITISGGSSTTGIDWCLDLEMATTGANGNIININNNQFLNCNKTVASTAAFTALWINTAATTVNVLNNYFYGFTYAGTGTSQVILSQLAGIGSLNINNNTIDSTVLTGANASGTHHNIGITAAPTLAVNINSNSITRTYLNTLGTGAKTLYPIFCSATIPTININDNTIDSVTRNGTTGGTTIGIMQQLGTSGTTTINCRRNTIRNMSISGTGTASIMYGIQLGTGTIVCDSNVVTNLLCAKTTGTGAMYGIYDISSPTVETYSNNRISNLTHLGTGIVYGIYAFTTTGTRLVTGNTINALTGNGGNVIGLLMTSSSPTITRNKIYSLRSNGATTGTVFGISITSVGTAGIATVANNLIDSLVAPNYGGTTDAIRGISSVITLASSNLRIYYNTISLNATSTGANFFTSNVFFTGSTTATTATLDLRNNILVNNSVANGTGNAVALRNATTDISNYATTSNNNLFYAGVPSAANLIYNDGTNSDQTLTAFKTRLSTFERASITENPTFISLNGTSPDYLHLDLTVPTRCESGGVNIAGITTDYDNVIRQGNAGYVGTGSAPDIGADEGQFTGILMVVDSIMVDQNTAAVPLNSVNQQVVAIRIHTSNNFNALNLSSLRLNTIGTTNVNDIQNAKVFFTGNSPVFNTGTQYGSVVTAPNGLFTITGSRQLTSGVNYFWVTYDTKSTSTPNNFIDVRVDSLVLAGINYAPVNGNPAGSRRILAPLNGNYNVGLGQTYPTITAAAADLGSLGVSGPVRFILKDALYSTASGEVFPIVVNAYAGSSATNTVTIRPDLGLISRIESANATATVDLNGVNNLIIDGRQGGIGGFVSGNSLTIANTNGRGPAIRFINEASLNRILYADLRSNDTIAPGTLGAGVVNFGTTTGINGNDGNIIRYCDIHDDAAGFPTTGISSIGSAASDLANNDGNIIDSCNIYNFFHPTIATTGIYVGANNGSWTINANRFYQTADRVQTGAAITNRVLWITPNTASLTSASGFVINNNFIGGNNASGTGNYVITGATTHQFTAMDISVGLGIPTSIQNNTITNFIDSTAQTASLAFSGINIVNGNVNCGTIQGNIVGSRTTNGAITLVSTSTTTGGIICIRTGGGTNNTINLSNNIVSGINLFGTTPTSTPEFFGFNLFGGTNVNVTNNMVGDPNQINSIHIVTTSPNSTSIQRVSGIFANPSAAGSVFNITNNTIANFTNNYSATGTQSSSTRGIVIIPTNTGTFTVNNNLIRNLSTATQTTAGTPAPAIAGIAYSSTSATPISITGNTISSLVLTGTSTTAAVQSVGISFGGPVSSTNLVSRNSVHSLSIIANNPAAFITGFDIGGGTANIQNNMIRLGYDSLGVDVTSSATYRGISKFSGNFNFLFNSIFIGGNGVAAGTSNTFAFARNSTGTDVVRNNIFVNNRSNGVGTGKHYQVFLSGVLTLTLNNNIYFGNGTGAVFGTTNGLATGDVLSYTSGWVASDVNSRAADPQFINAIGSANTGDLHISAITPTPIESGGVAISGITDDFDGQTRTGLTPTDIGADAGNFVLLDLFAPVIATPIATNTSSTADRTLNINITDVTGVPNTSGNGPKVYFKKMMAGTFQNTGAVRTSGPSQNGQWNFTISASAMGGLSLGDSVYFYIVAQDSSAAINLSSLPAGAVGTNVNSISTPPTTLFSYRIVPGLSGTVNVGIGQTYTSLTNVGGLFEAVNNGSLDGNLTATITSDLIELGTNGINQINETGTGNYTFAIVPDGPTERLIVGNVQGAGDIGGLIRLNGADRVKIDGSFGGSGRFLRFRNRAFNTTFIPNATIRFQNDAKLDTVRNCFIEGTDQAVGTVFFAGTNVVGGSGNDSNGVINCVIRDTLGNPTTGQIPNTALASQGTAGIGNDYNTFANNEVFNHAFALANLLTTAGDFWNISNNIVYQVIVKTNAVILFQIDGGVGHTISNNSIGGSNASRGGAAYTTTSTFTAIRVISPTASSFPTTISNNTISNITATGAINGINATTAFAAATPLNITGNTITNLSALAGGVTFGIQISGGTATVSNNTIDSIVTGTLGSGGGIDFAGGAGTSVLIQNNTISNFRTTATATTRAAGISVVTSTAGLITINNNTIRNVSGAITGTSAAISSFRLGGIVVQSAPPSGLSITNNTIENIRSTNTGTAAYAPVGILVTATSSNYTVLRNRIRNIGAAGTGTGTNAPVVHGIQLAGSSINSMVANNQISLGDSALNQSIIMGISDYSTTANTFAYNTVFINGVTASGANNTYGFFRNDAASNINLVNNIIYNKRSTLGTGRNFAIGALSSALISSASINYNLLVVNDTAALIEFPTGTVNGWGGLNSLFTSTYNTNWTERTQTIAAHTLFTDTLLGNLGIVTTNSNSWYAHGKGIALAMVTNDFNNVPRSTTIAGGATDIGSVEFTTSTLPIAATASAAPAANTTTTYTLAGRQVASINWGSLGTFPSAISVLYYSGINAPNLISGSTRYNSYYNIAPTGGSGYNYGISFIADSAQFGNVSGNNNSRIARYTGTNWNLIAASNASALTGTMQTASNSQNVFGLFTGTDALSNPLPVRLLQFSATQNSQAVELKWSTALEINNQGFDIQRSLDAETFESIGFMKGKQNSNTLSQYQFSDLRPFELNKVNRFFYRLKQIDLNGDYAYSNIVEVSDMNEETISLYPNPMLEYVKLGIKADQATTASIEVYSVQGNQMLSFKREIEKGYQQYALPELENMSAGVYIVVVEIDGKSDTHKLIKM